MNGRYAVPSAFTRPGFELMKTAIAEANQKLSEDDWVMGELGKKELAQTTDAAKLEDRYYRDYADHWLKFVKAVDIKPYRTKAEATAALQTFSQANSPMEILLKEVARNTNLSAKPENPGWIQWIKSFFVSEADSDTGGTAPEKEFRPLFTFVGTKKDKADATPVGKYRGILGQVFNDFNGISDNKMKEIADKLSKDESDPIKLRQRETSITSLLGGFEETPSGQALSFLIQRPLGNLRTLLGADQQTQIVKAWNEQILPDGKEIEKGYPFADSQTETDLTKLSAFLAPNEGKFSKFYDEKLSRYFEESNGQLKVKDGSGAPPFSDEFIAYLNNLMNLRKALYGTNPTPKFEYEFTLRPVKDAIVEISLDGTPVKSEGTGSIKGTFPGAGAAETGVLISLGSTSGTTTGAPSNSNTSTTPSSSASTLKYQGNWGLFRFFDASHAVKQPGGEYLLTFTVGGKPVTATIKSSGGDLFNRTTFTQVRIPQNFLKQ